ncbi:histone deacetylase 11 isoform X2 [Anas acuta]|uniref:histone deacetylase 11 isoform X2 n=1 Tax=Anas acuta TaxID=28680 RepID=UPI0035C8CAEC
MPHRSELYEDVPSVCWPIVYSPDYNITFMGLEKLHPFDAGKWGKVINFLKEEKLIGDDLIVQAREATDEDLLVVHTRRYLNKLKWSFVVATITEIPPVLFLPNFLVQRKVLKPLRTQTGGTIMEVAFITVQVTKVEGFVHMLISHWLLSSYLREYQGCPKPQLSIWMLTRETAMRGISWMIREYILWMRTIDIFIQGMDLLNQSFVCSVTQTFLGAIKRKVELEWGTEDTEYLQKVHTHVEGALNELKPDIIVYNAGTDILDGDPLGGLAISPQGIVKRDEVVFKAARSRRIPILMVTSGGYQKRTARIIADSILNLHNLGLIDKE